MRMLFVCSGNICRSPFAEGLARLMSDGEGRETASAGTVAIAGNPATPMAVTAAAGFGIDLSAHRATPLTGAALAGVDVVFAMERKHLDAVRGLSPSAHAELLDPDGAPIPDPYRGTRADYEAAYALIRQALRRRLGDGPWPPRAPA